MTLFFSSTSTSIFLFLLLKMEQSVCLADYCSIFRCDVLKRSKQFVRSIDDPNLKLHGTKKVLNDQQLTILRARCAVGEQQTYSYISYINCFLSLSSINVFHRIFIIIYAYKCSVSQRYTYYREPTNYDRANVSLTCRHTQIHTCHVYLHSFQMRSYQ
jgi:hypothetical protein